MKRSRHTICHASLGSILLTALVGSAAQAQVMPTLVQRNDYYAAQQPVMDVAQTPPGGFSAEINGTQNFTYDSNPLRVNTGEKAIWGSTTAPQLVLREKTPTSLIESTSTIDANAYNRSEFDSVDLHENLFFSHSNERWTASLRTLFDRDTTRESEIVNYGSTQARVYSNRIEAIPSLSYQQNEQDKWSIYGSALHDSYSDNTSNTDFNFYTVSPTYEHQFDMNNTGRIALNGQRYETASGPDSASNSYGPSIGWTNKATPRLTLHADAGTTYTATDGTTGNSDDGNWDYVFSAGIGYKGVQNIADITAQRAHEPFGNGTESLVDSIVATGTHNINDMLSIKANADYREANYDGVQTGINLDHEYSAGAGLDYKIMKKVSLTANYTYHDETLINQSGNTNEHIVMLGLALHPSWSPQ